jgi:glycolate oxidase
MRRSLPARPKSPFARLQSLLPAAELRTEPSFCAQFAGDKWFARHQPEAVALPRSAKSVASVLRFANEHRLPVTARGAGYGYVGSCVPNRGGIVLSLERMNRIKEINEDDFVAVVEPGVLTAALQVAAEKRRLFYPPDPASRKDCTLGGNIATNAGGPRCLKYGVTRDYVLGLEVALADGSLVRLGSRTHKNKTGFDLHRLFVGSEGMLGIITEATLKLLPLPPYRACLAVGFRSTLAATRGLKLIFRAGFLPCALEIADSFTLAAARKRTGSKQLEGCESLFIVELDGQEGSVRAELRELERILRPARPVFVQSALGPAAAERLWRIRREFSYALRDTGLTKLNQDIVVPRGRLEDLFQFTAHLQKRHALPIAAFGHAGDGNIHVNIMLDRTQPGADSARSRARRSSGRSGVGRLHHRRTRHRPAKLRWWTKAADEHVRSMHRAVKRARPRGILNPGKFV